ncbi:MAG: hypothetical protein WCR52_17875 [Bacteroidota bacterium]
MKYKGLWQLLGFSLIVFGFTGMVLQMVGTQWVFMQFLEIPGRLFAFVAKVLMVMFGFVITFLVNTDWERERQESSE